VNSVPRSTIRLVRVRIVNPFASGVAAITRARPSVNMAASGDSTVKMAGPVSHTDAPHAKSIRRLPDASSNCSPILTGPPAAASTSGRTQTTDDTSASVPTTGCTRGVAPPGKPTRPQTIPMPATTAAIESHARAGMAAAVGGMRDSTSGDTTAQSRRVNSEAWSSTRAMYASSAASLSASSRASSARRASSAVP